MPQKALERDEGALREGLHIAWWVWLLLLATLATLFTPLAFGSPTSGPLVWMTVYIACVVAIAAALSAAAHYLIGTRRAVNIAAAVILVLGCAMLVMRGKTMADAAQMQREQDALKAVREAQGAYRSAIAFSSSGWWELDVPDASQLLAQPLARYPQTSVTHLVEAALPVVRELESREAAYRQAVRAFHDAGGLTAHTLKTRETCDARMALLRSIDRATSAELESLTTLQEEMQRATAAIDAPNDIRAATIATLSTGSELAAAISLRTLDHEYAERAISYIQFLRKNSGKWTVTTKDNTIYLGYDLSRGEFLTLQRKVNDIADRQRGIQRSSLKLPEKVLARGQGRGSDLTGSSAATPSDRSAEAGVR